MNKQALIDLRGRVKAGRIYLRLIAILEALISQTEEGE